jgi:hypothetical protein
VIGNPDEATAFRSGRSDAWPSVGRGYEQLTKFRSAAEAVTLPGARGQNDEGNLGVQQLVFRRPAGKLHNLGHIPSSEDAVTDLYGQRA